MTCTLQERLCIFKISSRWTLRRMRNISDKSYRENQNMHLIFSSFVSSNYVLQEIMWRNVVQPKVKDDSLVWNMHIACWITKTTNTHLESVILIAFPLQQRLFQSAPMSRYTSIASLVFCIAVIYYYHLLLYWRTVFLDIVCCQCP